MKKNDHHTSGRFLRFVTLLIAILVMSISIAQAQPEDNGGDPSSSDIPLDGGIAWLLAGGAVHAFRVLRQKKSVQATTKRMDGKQEI